FRAQVSGEVRVGGRTFTFTKAPANAAHYWGKTLAERRAWAVCNSFSESPDFSFEGVTARVRMFGLLLPRVSYLSFYWDGQMYQCNGLLRSLLNRTDQELFSWRFAAINGRYRFRGEATGRPENMFAHRYESPDGVPDADQYIHVDFTADLK